MESYRKENNTRMIVYHIEKHGIYNSEGHAALPSNWLDFLTEGSPNIPEYMPSEHRLFTNLDYCVANLLRALELDKGAGQRLIDNRKLYLIPENTELFYIPGKFFSITLGKDAGAPTYQFADCSQYLELPLIRGGHDADRAIEACIKSKIAGKEVVQCLRNLGLSPTTLTSPIKAYQNEVLNKLDLPTIRDMPEEAAEWAYECSHRQWVEAFKIGHWNMAYDYDITSAYASELAKMPDIRYGKWLKASKKPYDAILGFLRGWVSINTQPSPIMYEKETYTAPEYYTPTGRWYCYLTQAETDFIQLHQLGSFELIDGWWFVPNKQCPTPIAQIMQDLHNRKELSSGLCKDIIKKIMVGCYGKTLESWSDRFGTLFNPVWGATVETNTRLKVAEFCLQAQASGCNPLHISVDGVLLDAPISIPINNELGSWKSSGQAPLIIVSSGTVGFDDSRQTNDNFSLSYNKLRSLISSSPDSSEYKLARPSIVSIPVALSQNAWDKLGDVYGLERSINIQGENKRYYPEAPDTGRELLERAYDSEPWDSYLLEEVEA